VLACGYGAGAYKVQPNRVIGYHTYARGQDGIELQGLVRHGDSGGPIFDAAGKVVAIINAREEDRGAAAGVTHGTHCRPIREFLQRVRQRFAHLFQKRNANNGEAERPDAATPPPSPQPLPEPQAPAADLGKLLDRLGQLRTDQRAVLDAVKAGQKPDGAVLEAFKQQAADNAQRLESLRGGIGALHDRLDDVHGAVAAIAPQLPKMQAAIERARPLAAAVAPAIALIPGVGPELSAAILAVAGAGGTWSVLSWLNGRRSKAAAGDSQSAPHDAASLRAILDQLGQLQTAAAASGASVAAASPGAVPSTAAQPVVIHEQSPPPPQVTTRERTFVPVEMPSPRLKALEWAMDEYVRKYPGARPVIEAIESFAEQFNSGTN
jgi:hypothetical protein